MPEARKLQAWLTIRGPASGILIQDEDEWLDLEDYEDLVIWHEISDQSNVEKFTIETSPVRDESMFLEAASLSISVSSAPALTSVLLATADVPLARYVRWKVTARLGSPFSLTFRAWVVATRRSGRPRLAMLAPPMTMRADLEPGEFWPGDDDDDSLFDDATRLSLSTIARICGNDDPALQRMRRDLRVLVWNRQQATAMVHSLQGRRLPAGSTWCVCPSDEVSNPERDELP